MSEAREVLAYVPHAMGFHPRSSVVAISLRPPRGRIGLVARVDLADLAGAHGAEVAEGLAEHLERDGAGGVFVVVYVDGRLAHARRDPAAVAAVAALEAAVPVPVTDVWLVAEDGYGSLRCDDPSCCPEPGRDLADLGTTQIGAAMVMAGSAPVDSREQLHLGSEEDELLREAFDGAARRERGLRARAVREGRQDAWRRTRLRRAVRLLCGGAGAAAGDRGAEELGAFAESVADLHVRDAVLVSVLTARDVRDEGELLDALDSMFLDGAAPPPRERVDAARAALTAAVRLSEGATRGRLLGLLAWLCWWCGDGAQAQVMAEDSLALHDGDRLALLVERALAAGMAPGWARGVA